MKKLMMLVGLALVGSAGAQSWEVEDLGTVSLVGCYGKQDGIYCDLTFSLTKKQTYQLYWSAYRWKAYGQDGTAKGADSIAFVDGKFGSSSNTKDIIANVPTKLQLYFNIPNTTTSFRALAFNDVKFDNIPVRPYSTASASAPQAVTKLPFSSTFTFSNYKGSFSNCQQQGANYVCTATINRK